MKNNLKQLNKIYLMMIPLIITIIYGINLSNEPKIYKGELVIFYDDDINQNYRLMNKIKEDFFKKRYKSIKNSIKYQNHHLKIHIYDRDKTQVEQKLKDLKEYILEKRLSNLTKSLPLSTLKDLPNYLDNLKKHINKIVELKDMLKSKQVSLFNLVMLNKYNNQYKYYMKQLQYIEKLQSEFQDDDVEIKLYDDYIYPKFYLFIILVYFLSFFITFIILIVLNQIVRNNSEN